MVKRSVLLKSEIKKSIQSHLCTSSYKQKYAHREYITVIYISAGSLRWPNVSKVRFCIASSAEGQKRKVKKHLKHYKPVRTPKLPLSLVWIFNSLSRHLVSHSTLNQACFFSLVPCGEAFPLHVKDTKSTIWLPVFDMIGGPTASGL